MKKIFILFTVAFTLFLASCDKEVDTIPDDAIVAICIQGNTFQYIYKEDVLYEFYSDGVLQSDDMKNIVQNSVDSIGTVRGYIDTTFQPDVCTFSGYTPSEKE